MQCSLVGRFISYIYLFKINNFRDFSNGYNIIPLIICVASGYKQMRDFRKFFTFFICLFIEHNYQNALQIGRIEGTGNCKWICELRNSTGLKFEVLTSAARLEASEVCAKSYTTSSPGPHVSTWHNSLTTHAVLVSSPHKSNLYFSFCYEYGRRSGRCSSLCSHKTLKMSARILFDKKPSPGPSSQTLFRL